MTRRRAPLSRAGLAGLVLLLAVPASLRADEPTGDERRYAREQLLAEARAIETVAGEDESLEPLREAIAADREVMRARLAEPRAATPEEAALLDELGALLLQNERMLGRGGPEQAGAMPRGALGQARWLLRWMQGKEPCSVLVTKRGATAGTAYPYPLPKEPTPTAVVAPGAGAPPPTKDSPGPGGPLASPPLAVAPPAPAASESGPAAGPETEKDPWGPWVQGVLAKEGGLIGKTLLSGPCGDLTDLRAVANEDAKQEGGSAWAAEAKSPYDLNEPLLRLRSRQAKERVDAYTKEVPAPGLVEEATVREKVRRAGALADEVVALEQRRTNLVEGLDELVDRINDGRREAGDLAGQIDEAKRLEAPPPPAPGAAPAAPPSGTPPAAPSSAPLSLRVRVLEAREARNTLRQRLLYLGALRASARLRLLEEAIRLAQNEARAADLAKTRFADELDQVRRERQVDRLEYERARLRSGLVVAEREATSAEQRKDPARQIAADKAFLAAARALLAAHDVAREAVRAYRSAGVRADAGHGAPSAPVTGSAGDDLLLYRAPSPTDLDSTYVEGALARIQGFDRETVARNFDAVTRRIAALRTGTVSARASDAFRERFRVAAAEADAGIAAWAASAPRWAAWRGDQLHKTLDGAKDDLEDALHGIEAERARTTETLAVLVRYRAALLQQGERSLSIRTDPDVQSGSLVRGIESLSTGSEQVLRWLSLQGDAHLGTFAAAHLGPLAALALLAVGLFLGVSRGRTMLSERIDRLALRVPGIRTEGANVEEERRDEKSREAHADAAIEAKADELIRQAAGEETAGDGAAEAATGPATPTEPLATPTLAPAPPEGRPS